jgi:protocatechuate 4,5-dioxygenase alpha chain
MSDLTPHVEGAYIYDTETSRVGRGLNKMLYSLKDPANREAFAKDEAAYVDRYPLTPEQRQAVLDRDWEKLTDSGATIFYMLKLAIIDGVSIQDLGGIYTGMTTEEFKAELAAGGRKFG